MGRMGKIKGAQFERKVCVALSLWVSAGKRNDIFWRSAMSGGRATLEGRKVSALPGRVRLRKHHSQAGDVSAVHPIGAVFVSRYVVECKTYRDLHYQSIIHNAGIANSILAFWLALLKSASADRHPMLICKQNHGPCLVALDSYGMDCMYRAYRPVNHPPKPPHVVVPRYDMHIYLFNAVLESDYDRFIGG